MADDDPFADYKKWLDPVGTSQAETTPSFNIAKEEKLNDIARRESGWRNVPNAEGSDASGYFQFRPGTWQEAKQLANIPADKYPDPMSADYSTQRQAASALFDKYGEKPWAASAGGAPLMSPSGDYKTTETTSTDPITPPIPMHSQDPSGVAPPPPPPMLDRATEVTAAATKPPLAPASDDPFANYKQWLRPPEEPTIVQKGLTSAGIETEQLYYLLRAQGSKLLGNEDGMRDYMGLAKSLNSKLETLQPRYTNIDDVINRGNVGDFVDWLGFNVGEQLPTLGTMMLGGGLAKYIATGLTRAVGEGIIDKEIAEQALAKIGRRASLAGSYAVLAAQTTGQITQEQYQATGNLNPLAAAGFGALAAVPAMFSPGAIGARFGLTGPLAADFGETIRSQVMKAIPGFFGRRIGGAVGYGLEAAAGNVGQALVMGIARKYVDQNYALLGPDNANRILQAAESGALFGGVLGAVMPTAPHVKDEYISRQLNKMAGLDPNHVSKPVEFTQADDKRIRDVFPLSDSNQTVSHMMQAMSDTVVAHGGYDAMSDVDKQNFASRMHSLETLGPLADRLSQEIKAHFADKTVTADDGTEFNPVAVHVNLKDQTVDLTGLGGVKVTKSLSDVPVYEMTVRAIDDMYKKGIPLTAATPDGFASKSMGETSLNGIWKINMPMAEGQRIYDAAGSTLEDIKGRPVKMDNLPVGVSFAKGKGEDHIFSTKTRAAINYLVKKLAPGAKLLLDTHSGGMGSPLLYGKTNPYITPMGNGQYMIFMPKRADQVYQHYALFHELSHLVTWHNFGKLSPARQVALLNHYSNSLRDPTAEGIKDMLRDSAGYSLQKRLGDGSIRPKDFEKLLKWWNLDEHFAEQFAKSWLTKQKGFVDKYFDDSATKMQQILEGINAANKDLNLNLQPHEAMAGWFDSIYNNEPGFTGEILDTLLKSSKENAEAMGVKVDPGASLITQLANAPPEASENSLLRDAPPQAGVTPQIAAQADKFSRFTRWIWNTYQRAKMNPHIEPLRRLSQLFSQFNADRMIWANRANDVLVQQANLGKERSKMLDTLEATLDHMPYLGRNESARMPNAAEMGHIIRSIGMSREDWQAIKPVYEAKRLMYRDALDRMEETAMNAAQRIQDPTARAAKINSISYEMSAMRNRPYFPHMRYGDYAVMVRDAQSNKKLHYSLYYTQREAQKAAQSLQSQFAGSRIEMSKIPHEARQWIGLPPGLLDQLRTMPYVTPEQQDWIDNFRFEMSPENSFTKRMMRRSGLPGFDMNSARAFANYFSSASGHMARLKFGYDIDQAVKDLYKSAKTDFPDDLAQSATRTEMADWASQEARYVMHPPNEYGAVRSFAFQWWLAFNPSTAFVHLMQMPMFTAPYMSKFYGGSGILHMMRAYGDWRQLYKDPTNSTLEPEFMRGQQRGGHEGIFTENRGTELARWADHSTLNRAMNGTRLQQFLTTMGGATSWIMRQVEKNNRLVTFRAAWKAALENPNNPMVQKLVAENDMLYRELLADRYTPETAAAYIAARDAVQATHFQYTQIARPRWQRGALNPFTPFMMYKQQALHFYFHNPAGLRALGMLFAVSGLAGMPFEQDASDFAKFIGEKVFGTRFDFNEWVRSVAKEFTDHPEVVMHGFGHDGLGIPQLFNALGLPISGFDVSRRLGYGELIPTVQDWTRDQQESFWERFGHAVTTATGGALQVPIEIANQLSGMPAPMAFNKLMEQGGGLTLRGLEGVMPSILRNGLQAMRYYQQGGDVGPAGEMRTPMHFNDTSGWSAMIEKALGFTPTAVSERNEVVDTARQVEAYWKIRQAQVSRMYVQMRMMGDQQGIADALAAVKQFNQDSPLRGVKIKAAELIAQLKSQAQRNRMEQLGRDKSGAMQLVRPDFPEYQPPGPNTYIPSSPQPPPS